MTKEEEYYHKIASAISGAEKSQMFGKPCYKINKKAFCCFFENEMVFKLKFNSELYQEAISLDGTKLFDPSGKGRAMKEWVQVSFEYVEFWEKFADSAVEYLKS